MLSLKAINPAVWLWCALYFFQNAITFFLWSSEEDIKKIHVLSRKLKAINAKDV